MSYPSVITFQGIEEAIHGLAYKHGSALKSRLVAVIRGFYGEQGEHLDSIKSVSSEDLIRMLWDVDADPEFLRSKKKNLSSLKSLVNADLKRLYQEGKNPEGIVIGPENLFTISDEAKDDLLASFRTGAEGGGAGTLAQVREVVESLKEILSKSANGGGARSEMGSSLEQIKELVDHLSQRMGLAVFDGNGKGQGGSVQTIATGAAIGTVDSSSMEGTDPLLMEGLEGGEESSAVVEIEAESVETEVVNEPAEDFAEVEEVDAGEIAETADLVEEEVAPDDLDESVEELSGEIVDEPELAEDLAEVEEVDEAEIEEAVDLVEEELSGSGEIAESVEELSGEIVDEPELADDLSELEEVDEGEIEDGVDLVEEEFSGSDEIAESTEEPTAEESSDQEIPLWDLTGDLADAPELAEDLAEVEEVDEGEIEEAADLVEEEIAEPEDLAESSDDASGEIVDALELAERVAGVEEVDEGEIEEPLDLVEEEPSASNDLDESVEEVSGEVVDALELEEDLSGLEEVDEDEIEDAPEVVDELLSDDLSATVGDAAGESTPVGGSEKGGGTGGRDKSEYMDAAGASMDDGSWAERDEKKRARILAEKFSGSLSEMDRFYNRYILVSTGEYTVGPNTAGKAPRRVRMPQFYMGKFPVTNGLFDVFVEKTGYVTTAERVGYGTVYYGRFRKKVDEKTGGKIIHWNSSLTSKIVQGAFWYQPFGPGSTLHFKRNHPVIQVSLEDCMAFAAWAGKRLPNEEEWEAACRTVKGNLYPWGNRFRSEGCNFEKSGHGETTPVDLYLKYENEYGIADALGNVLEWTTSTIEHAAEPEESAVRFVAKGGSWITDKAVNLTSRTEVRSDFHSNILGFRCIAD